MRPLNRPAMVVALFLLLVPIIPAIAQEAAAEPELTALERFDAWFGEHVVPPLSEVLFFSVGLEDVENADGTVTVRSMPLIVFTLLMGGICFTFYFGWINIRLFRHGLDVVRGKYDHPDDAGEVSHFKALAAALAATIGLGNIAGVAIAITLGGPGAVFWMWICAIFGMTLQFASTANAQMYRRLLPDGRVLGGPMIYIQEGVKAEMPSMAGIAKVLAVVFAVLTVFSAFSAGNMFQANQTTSIIAHEFFADSENQWLPLIMGLSLAFLVGVVIIGGIRRIGDLSGALVPTMCIFYCGVCLVIIILNFEKVPSMFLHIFQEAFAPEAIYGGFIGVLVQGVRRASFSNEAGLGSAAIAQAAAKTREPIQAGLVAMMGPFIDTICVCTMTALAILITDAHMAGREMGLQGVEITSVAFSELGRFTPWALCLSVFVFAYSTIISWGYYGERAMEYLLGARSIVPYRVVYVCFVAIGPLLSLRYVVDFADMLLLSMAFPNIIGMALLAPNLRRQMIDYLARLRSGSLVPRVERQAVAK